MENTLSKYPDKYINYFIIIPIVCAVVLSQRHIDYTQYLAYEAWSITFANLNWKNLLSVMWQRELNMGLYYISLKIWVTIFGESELAVRSLSVVFSIFAIVMTFAIGKRLFDAKIGLVAATILSVNVFFIESFTRSKSLYAFDFYGEYICLLFYKNTRRSTTEKLCSVCNFERVSDIFPLVWFIHDTGSSHFDPFFNRRKNKL